MEGHVSRSVENIAGSAVMPAARIVFDPNRLLDELELRLTRCTVAGGPVTGQPRIGAILTAGELLHRIARSETRSWWNEQGLSELDPQSHARILDAMLERSPCYLAWGAVPLVAGYLDGLLDADVLLRLVEWVTVPEPTERVVRDAVALDLVVPWLEQQPETLVRETLDRLCQAEDRTKARMGLMAAAAYVRGQEEVEVVLQRALLDVCWLLGKRVEPETAMSVGWVLRELAGKGRDRVLPELRVRVHELSRQAMRVAVERLPRELRVELTSKWQSRIHRGTHGLVAVGPPSAARVKRRARD
jgi:hypothetical protein